jgi:predicted site-specific integrase-resolvase
MKKRPIFRNLGITVEIMENREKKYEEELAEDIMKILTCYSARYYGARGGRKKKIEVVESNAI